MKKMLAPLKHGAGLTACALVVALLQAGPTRAEVLISDALERLAPGAVLGFESERGGMSGGREYHETARIMLDDRVIEVDFLDISDDVLRMRGGRISTSSDDRGSILFENATLDLSRLEAPVSTDVSQRLTYEDRLISICDRVETINALQMSGVRLIADPDGLPSEMASEQIDIETVSLRIAASDPEACSVQANLSLSGLTAVTPTGSFNLQGLDLSMDLPNAQVDAPTRIAVTLERLLIADPSDGTLRPVAGVESVNLNWSLATPQFLDLVGDLESRPDAGWRERAVASINHAVMMTGEFQVQIANARLGLRGVLEPETLAFLNRMSGAEAAVFSMTARISSENGTRNTAMAIEVPNLLQAQLNLLLRFQPIDGQTLANLAAGQRPGLDVLSLVEVGSMDFVIEDQAASTVLERAIGMTLPVLVRDAIQNVSERVPDGAGTGVGDLANAAELFFTAAREARMRVSARPEVPIDLITLGALISFAPQQAVEALGIMSGVTR